LVRESSGEITSKEGFSVVAPIKDDVAGFNMREKGILLGFIEAVNFVDEDDGCRWPERDLCSATAMDSLISLMPARNALKSWPSPNTNPAPAIATIVFVDEVHRFNKAQQDAFSPAC